MMHKRARTVCSMFMLCCLMLLGSCGLDVANIELEPPVNVTADNRIVTFQHNPANDQDGFLGYEVYYKFYSIEPIGTSEHATDRSRLTSTSLNPASLAESVLNSSYGYFKVWRRIDDTPDEETPLISEDLITSDDAGFNLNFTYAPAQDAFVSYESEITSLFEIVRANGKDFWNISRDDIRTSVQDTAGDILVTSSMADALGEAGTVPPTVNLALVIFAYGFFGQSGGGAPTAARSRVVVTDLIPLSTQ